MRLVAILLAMSCSGPPRLDSTAVDETRAAPEAGAVLRLPDREIKIAPVGDGSLAIHPDGTLTLVGGFGTTSARIQADGRVTDASGRQILRLRPDGVVEQPPEASLARAVGRSSPFVIDERGTTRATGLPEPAQVWQVEPGGTITDARGEVIRVEGFEPGCERVASLGLLVGLELLDLAIAEAIDNLQDETVLMLRSERARAEAAPVNPERSFATPKRWRACGTVDAAIPKSVAGFDRTGQNTSSKYFATVRAP